MRYKFANWDSWANDIRSAMGPADGHYITQELVTVHWMRETNERGDIIYRKMSADEVEVMEANDAEGNK